MQYNNPELIRVNVEEHEEFDYWWTNSEAQSRSVCESDIDKNDRWEKIESVGARKLKLLIRDNYTDD